MSSLFYFFKESLTGFSRNLGTALGSIVTIFLSLLIIGIFLVGGGIVNNVMSSVEEKVSITAYVADDADQSSIDSVMSTVQSWSEVANVGFTTKDQALENFEKSMSSSEIVAQLDGQNPLPASIDIELSDPQMVESVAQRLAEDSTFQSICDNPEDPTDSVKYGASSVERLFEVTNYVRYIGVALIALLIFVALVFINNTIRLAILARRKEISIMRLVGASNGFIRGPFLMEAALHAIIGSLLAIGSLELLRRFALSRVSDAFMWLPVDLSGSVYIQIYVTLIVAGLFIAAVGAFFAMRRYLKV
ncbi:permease-like cell division protein FtsX [uncultured Slackia sp.]|uniref:permease-like cell division protein FtsX n=1 Tax=uncultured Slackia sp. TaxID=665903 RepID=UPI0025F9462E|nr:permease-like cell division protein FtsX [uncultured Slackia sp.]